MRKNIIRMADAYKYGHKEQLPITEGYMHSYVEGRIGGRFDEAIVFGLQAFIKEYLSEPFNQQDIDEMDMIITSMGLDFNRKDWELILKDYGGRLPIEIRSLPEGSVVPAGVPQAFITNTDPRFPWLPAFMETAILRACWYPSTVASTSYDIKKELLRYAEETVGSTEFVDFQLHDFGARGVSSEESAQLGGMGHLLVFKGTDTVTAIPAAMEYYYATLPVGFSVPASEHSTMIAWGQEDEFKAYQNMVDQFGKPGSIVSVVSDSYDIYKASTYWFSKYDEIKNIGCKVVIRPDSGDPVITLTNILRIAGDMLKDVIVINEKGYKELPPEFGILWGDGIDRAAISRILSALKGQGWASSNMVFGMGGGLLQRADRDVVNYACKSSHIASADRTYIKDISKTPMGDQTKKSKAGLFDVIEKDGTFVVTEHKQYNSAAKTVFRDGVEIGYNSWNEVVDRVQKTL